MLTFCPLSLEFFSPMGNYLPSRNTFLFLGSKPLQFSITCLYITYLFYLLSYKNSVCSFVLMLSIGLFCCIACHLYLTLLFSFVFFLSFSCLQVIRYSDMMKQQILLQCTQYYKQCPQHHFDSLFDCFVFCVTVFIVFSHYFSFLVFFYR